MPEREYLIALSSFLSFGPARTGLLINYFGSAKNAWLASTGELMNIGLKEKVVADFTLYRRNFNFKEHFGVLKKLSVSVVTLFDDDYPANLKGLPGAPFVLYVRGSLKKSDANAIAIVGSRMMTSYGREVTRKFSAELGALGVTIVSGLAFGVDLAAHQACLEAGGRCIAVLAGGVDEITPRSNEWLGLKIISTGGAIVSEFPPGIKPQKHFFPFRNRIISGLSKAVIVTEGAIKSGTIHTVRHAAEQGRTVFAVPGPITSPMSQAPLYLIKTGAKVLTETKDILDELNLQLKVDSEKVEKIMPSDTVEEQVFDVLTREEMHIDEIARSTGYSINILSSKLTIMELKGLVLSLGKGVYRRV